ncbi:MAG: 3'-phosphoesterase [Bacteroidetes bacterium]|nr:MAG: 3'-phosphoesterase [Bacteroidota bacterium]
MSLVKYKQKRNFSSTPEPGALSGKGDRKKLIFVVQRHKATSLHYDFRLEWDGVLKSWAVPKGPSMNPADKRLAMMVEDHPLDYAGFKGVIPEGNYGAGIVEIWDNGWFEPTIEVVKGKPVSKSWGAGLKRGSLKFTLHGKKLKGEFALVKIKTTPNSWLLIKHKDKYAVEDAYDSEKLTPAGSPINKLLKKK